MGESIYPKALDYALGLNNVMIIADDGTLSEAGLQPAFPAAKNLASLAGLKLRNVVNSFSGNFLSQSKKSIEPQKACVVFYAKALLRRVDKFRRGNRREPGRRRVFGHQGLHIYSS